MRFKSLYEADISLPRAERAACNIGRQGGYTPVLVDDCGLHPRPGCRQLGARQWLLLEACHGAPWLVVVMMVMVEPRRRGGVLVVVEAEHETAGADPTGGTRRRVQLASPRGRHGIQLHGGRACRRRCRRQRQRWPRGSRRPHVSPIAAREVLGPRLVGFCLQRLLSAEDYTERDSDAEDVKRDLCPHM
jgi:hypothetical protein